MRVECAGWSGGAFMAGAGGPYVDSLIHLQRSVPAHWGGNYGPLDHDRNTVDFLGGVNFYEIWSEETKRIRLQTGK